MCMYALFIVWCEQLRLFVNKIFMVISEIKSVITVYTIQANKFISSLCPLFKNSSVLKGFSHSIPFVYKQTKTIGIQILDKKKSKIIIDEVISQEVCVDHVSIPYYLLWCLFCVNIPPHIHKVGKCNLCCDRCDPCRVYMCETSHE